MTQASGRQSIPARPPVTDISVWVERFSLMAGVLVTRFPDKVGELFAYQASIIRVERNYEGKQWVVYDRHYRREALARKDLNWSLQDSRLYNETFTGRAKAIAQCNVCLQDDYTASSCLRNPHQPMLAWLPDLSSWPGVVDSDTPIDPSPVDTPTRKGMSGLHSPPYPVPASLHLPAMERG